MTVAFERILQSPHLLTANYTKKNAKKHSALVCNHQLRAAHTLARLVPWRGGRNRYPLLTL